jgi:hypothetical protein
VTAFQRATEVHAVRQLSSHTRDLKAQWASFAALLVNKWREKSLSTYEMLIDFRAVTVLDLQNFPVNLLTATPALVSLTVGLVVTSGATFCRSLAACCSSLKDLDLTLFGVCDPGTFRHFRDLPELPCLTRLRRKCVRVPSVWKVVRSLMLSASGLEDFEFVGNGAEEVLPLLAAQAVSSLSAATLPAYSRVLRALQSEHRAVLAISRLRVSHQDLDVCSQLVDMGGMRGEAAVMVVASCHSLVLDFKVSPAAVVQLRHASPGKALLDAIAAQPLLQEVTLVLADAGLFEQAVAIPCTRLQLEGQSCEDSVVLDTASLHTKHLILEHFVLFCAFRQQCRASLELRACSLQFELQDMRGLRDMKLLACTLPNGDTINRACL